MKPRTLLWSAPAVLLLVVVAGYFWATRPRPVLTVTTWPGAYGRAQADAFFRPYGEANRIDVRIAQYDGGLDHVKDEVDSHTYDWDVVDFELDDAVAACQAGLLEPVDPSKLPAGADGSSVQADFVKGALGRCHVGTVVFSQVIAYAPARFPHVLPASSADFFDLTRFPGPRAMRRASAKLNLELALLADGARPDEVYPLLATGQGLARAFAKLQSIRPSIVWWTRSSEPLEMLDGGRAAMATALDGDVFDAVAHHRPIGMIWDRQLYELDVFGVPKGDPRKGTAMDFIGFASGPAPLARVAEWVPYGPARRSALPLVGKNPELGIAMAPFLPTSAQNFAGAFAVDDEWWRIHGPQIAPRWQAWLAQSN